MKYNLISMDKISGGNRKFFFSRKEMPGMNKTKLYIKSQRKQICPIPAVPDLLLSSCLNLGVRRGLHISP
jgi:hypothetical protein